MCIICIDWRIKIVVAINLARQNYTYLLVGTNEWRAIEQNLKKSSSF